MTKSQPTPNIIKQRNQNSRLLYDKERFLFHSDDISIFYHTNCLYLLDKSFDQKLVHQYLEIVLNILEDLYKIRQEPELIKINAWLSDFLSEAYFADIFCYLNNTLINLAHCNWNLLLTLSQALPVLNKLQWRPDLRSLFFVKDESQGDPGNIYVKAELLFKIMDDLESHTIPIYRDNKNLYFISQTRVITRTGFSWVFWAERDKGLPRGAYFRATYQFISALALSRNRLANQVYRKIAQEIIESY